MFLSKDSIANVAYDNIPYSTVRNNKHEIIYKNIANSGKYHTLLSEKCGT